MDLLVVLGVLLCSYCHVANGIDCSRFTFDDSLEDDSDYVGGSGGYNIGGESVVSVLLMSCLVRILWWLINRRGSVY